MPCKQNDFDFDFSKRKMDVEYKEEEIKVERALDEKQEKKIKSKLPLERKYDQEEFAKILAELNISTFRLEQLQQLITIINDRPRALTQIDSMFILDLIKLMQSNILLSDVLLCFSTIFTYIEEKFMETIRETILRTDFFELLNTVFIDCATYDTYPLAIIEIISSISKIDSHEYTYALIESGIIDTLLTNENLKEYSHEILRLLRDLLKMPGMVNSSQAYDQIINYIGKFMYYDDVEILKQAIKAFKAANEVGDVVCYILSNFEILNRIKECLYHNSPLIRKHAFNLISSLATNGTEVIDMLSKFFIIDDLFSGLVGDSNVIMANISMIIQIRRFTENQMLIMQIYIKISDLPYNFLFSTAVLPIKEKVLSMVKIFLENCPLEMNDICTEELLLFLCNYLNVDTVDAAYKVADIMLQIIDIAQSELAIMNRIGQIFSENEGFEFIDDALDEIDSSYPNYKVKEEVMNRFLGYFTSDD